MGCTGLYCYPTYNACRQPINGNASSNYLYCIWESLVFEFFYAVEFFVFCLFSRFLVCHHCLPYKLLFCIFTNFTVMSAKDTLETYRQLEPYFYHKTSSYVFSLNHYDQPSQPFPSVNQDWHKIQIHLFCYAAPLWQ